LFVAVLFIKVIYLHWFNEIENFVKQIIRFGNDARDGGIFTGTNKPIRDYTTD
jgi:hypothetical protein